MLSFFVLLTCFVIWKSKFVGNHFTCRKWWSLSIYTDLSYCDILCTIVIYRVSIYMQARARLKNKKWKPFLTNYRGGIPGMNPISHFLWFGFVWAVLSWTTDSYELVRWKCCPARLACCFRDICLEMAEELEFTVSRVQKATYKCDNLWPNDIEIYRIYIILYIYIHSMSY